MADVKSFEINGTELMIKDEYARQQLNNIANELGVDENGEAIELETTAQDIRPAINEVFQSVSNGKKIVAKAITDKGVNTLATDTFTQMATNIGQIQGSSGTVTTDIQNTLNRCGSKKLRFGVLSDIHLKGDVTNTIDVNFANALAKFEELGCNFATICGDLCNYDKTTEYPAYTSIISNCSIPIYEVTGNHDTGSGTLTEDDWITLTGNGFHFEIINNDEVFIFISQRKYEDYSNSDNNKMLTQADKDWISSKLEEHKTKSRVFLFMHQYLGGLDGFSRIDSGSESYIKYDLNFWTNVASTYKNVIWFSGHSHTPFSYQANYPNVLAYNKNGEYCTMIHVPSLMASNEYYVVDVYEHLVEIEGYKGGNVVDSIYFAIDDYIYIEEVESILLSSDTLNFANTDTQILTATVTPSSQQENLTWETSDSNIAIVAGGVVTPVGNGSCVITAKCGSITATCTVTVDIAESELYYSINSTLNGCTLSNTATRVKDGATYVATITESENTTINTVTIKMGGVDITDTAYNSNSKTIGIDAVTGNIEITVTVNKLVTGITLNQSAITLSSTGATQQLTATLTPGGAIGTVEWSSDNDSVATVVNGLITVTATTSGSCTITASCNGHSATCTVTVNIKTKTVVYSLDSVTANLTSSVKEIAIGSSRNLTLPTQLQKGLRYYLKAESFKYANGTDVDCPTEKVYIFCAGGYLGSKQVSTQIFGATAYRNVTTELELLDVYGKPITDDNNIDTLKDFIIKISSSSTKTLPLTVTLKGLEIYTYGESI